MRLIVVSYEAKGDGTYVLYFEYDGQRFLEEVKICQGVVLYIEYGLSLQKILHKNAGSVKSMHRLVFEVYREGDVTFPFYVGDF
ncbi:hypothetical protein [Pseudomonas protegens]|uniref:hypothetical protein n=1 Tax=Pseudomonas protegens TaxID=380021 RepID=UPI00275AA8AC|nr:hypothetical protein [Pseudomonas protegens]MDP9530588.1 hypothetical protein [Pseudomonas protegens]